MTKYGLLIALSFTITSQVAVGMEKDDITCANFFFTDGRVLTNRFIIKQASGEAIGDIEPTKSIGKDITELLPLTIEHFQQACQAKNKTATIPCTLKDKKYLAQITAVFGLEEKRIGKRASIFVQVREAKTE